MKKLTASLLVVFAGALTPAFTPTENSKASPAGEVGAATSGPIAQAQVLNKTQALQVQSIKVGEVGASSALEITVLNASEKVAVEYTFVRADGSVLTTSGATTGWGLAPGETDTVSAGYIKGETLSLAAVLFDDDTGQGEPERVNHLRSYRAGVAAQYRRVAPMFRQALENLAGSGASTILTELQGKLSHLPVKAQEAASVHTSSGLQHAKQFLQARMNAGVRGPSAVPGPPANPGDEIKATLEIIEKALVRLQNNRDKQAAPAGSTTAGRRSI